MDIITALPRYSDGEINRALIREITTGIQLKQNLEKEREKICAQHAEKVKLHAKFGFKNLRHLSVTPAWEWFNLRRKYGHQEITSKEFIKDYQKRFPHLSPNKL